MKKKILLLMIFCLLFALTGCAKPLDKIEDTGKVNVTGVEVEKEEKEYKVSDEYVELYTIGEHKDGGMCILRFKMLEDTSFWDTEDEYGAVEIDTVYVMKEDVTKDNYHYTDTNIIFHNARPDNFLNGATKLENSVFSHRRVKETAEMYDEVYIVDDGIAIQLCFEKNKFSDELFEKAKKDFHTIVETFEIVGRWDFGDRSNNFKPIVLERFDENI